MYIHFVKKGFVFVIYISLIILMTGCDEFLPDDYQDEDFTISDLDAKTCEYLSRDLFVTDTTFKDTIVADTVRVDTIFNTYPVFIGMNTLFLDDFVDSTWINKSDSLIISSLFDSICGATETLLVDTAIVVNYPEGADTSYIYYNHSNSNTAHFFVGWSYTEQNINATVDIEIIQKQAKLITEKSTPFPIATIGGCDKSFIMDAETSREEIHPVIRVRNSYDLNNGPYLIRIIVSKSPDVIDFPLRLAIVHDQ